MAVHAAVEVRGLPSLGRRLRLRGRRKQQSGTDADYASHVMILWLPGLPATQEPRHG
jgi:hypothetical protein